MRARPLLLDLFCGAGGAAVGYHRAGFDVVGVDIKHQPHYPFPFVQGDALVTLDALIDGCVMGNATVGAWRLGDFAAVHASAPCQAYAEAATTRKRADHPDLLDPTRERLIASGKPYVIENIATAPMPTSVLLCGATFRLPIIRHRRFEVEPELVLLPSCCPQRSHARAVTHGPGFYPYARGSWEAAWRKHVLPVVWPWMTLAEAGQAIPPAYTEHLGSHLIDHLNAEAVPA
jgi:DNA (cytosine-5)-methyltransferase 1